MTMTMILDADAVAEKMGWQAKPGRSDESNCLDVRVVTL